MTSLAHEPPSAGQGPDTDAPQGPDIDLNSDLSSNGTQGLLQPPTPTPSDKQGPVYLAVHRVLCSQSAFDGEYHLDHPKEAEFLDPPRLFRHDTHASALRGTQPAPPRADKAFWRNMPIVVTRTYDCHVYHTSNHGLFEAHNLRPDVQLPDQLLPWAYYLDMPGPDAQLFSSEIGISKPLRDALHTYTRRRESQMSEWSTRDDLQPPYEFFYHYRHRLRALPASSFGSLEKQHLSLLLDYMELTQGREFEEADSLFAQGLVSRRTFSLLFNSHEPIVTVRNGNLEAFYVNDVLGITRQRSDLPAYELKCWAWAFDGSFRKKPEAFVVTWPFHDPDQISVESLLAWPLRLDKSGLRDRLIRRGNAFWSSRKLRLVSYTSPDPTMFDLQVSNPKYMIDYQTYRQMYPGSFTQPALSEAEMLETGIDFNSDEPPNDLFCLLLPSTLIGYAFHDKKWRSLSVEHTEDVPWQKDAFSDLVLDTTKKETIKALVSIHLTKAQDVDIVQGKGNGLVILLHGSPGTGKTLTAESVAELAEKPLYRVTCGDVGTSAIQVEKYLETVLLLGGLWECVVLLDEADVFLEERSITDLQRNALVSVFLRVLEYYSGIMILTTNRVGTFDEAFKSRVQLAVHYPVLGEEERFDIWRKFLDILRDRKIDLEYKELTSKVPLLARLPFNGRQIRNNLWTAAQVAKYKGERLSYSHLDQVVKISKEFEDYLQKTHHGQSDDENARVQGTRHS